MKKIGFNYEYKSSNEIFDYIFSNNSSLDFLIYILLIIFLIITILYIGPKFILIGKKAQKNKKILMKKKMLNKMRISRDVENDIENELNNIKS